VRLLTVLDELAGDRHTGCAQELLQLGEIVAVRHRGDRERALLGASLGLSGCLARRLHSLRL